MTSSEAAGGGGSRSSAGMNQNILSPVYLMGFQTAAAAIRLRRTLIYRMLYRHRLDVRRGARIPNAESTRSIQVGHAGPARGPRTGPYHQRAGSADLCHLELRLPLDGA